MWIYLKNKYKSTDAWQPQFSIDVSTKMTSKVDFYDMKQSMSEIWIYWSEAVKTDQSACSWQNVPTHLRREQANA